MPTQPSPAGRGPAVSEVDSCPELVEGRVRAAPRTSGASDVIRVRSPITSPDRSSPLVVHPTLIRPPGPALSLSKGPRRRPSPGGRRSPTAAITKDTAPRRAPDANGVAL